MSALLTNLGIDWKLLLAQAINFGILVYILRRFVYQPVVETLEKRRQGIVAAQKNTELADTRIKEIEIEKEKVLAEARTKAKELIAKAEASAKKQSDEIVQEAERKAELVIAEGKSNLDRERDKMRSELKSEIGTVVAAAVEKTVGDFLSKEAEEKLKAEAMAIIGHHS